MKIEFGPGTSIIAAIDTAMAARSWRNAFRVRFTFNGVQVLVSGKTELRELVLRDWERAIRGYLGDNPTIGPVYSPVLSEEELASDAAIEAENKKRRDAAYAEYQNRVRQKTMSLQEALENAGPLELNNEEDWKQDLAANDDAYGARIMKYAEDWGRLMQTKIADGESIADCAYSLSYLADDDGITGFMYGAAVSTLAKHWKHGEELRRWHNRKTQIGNEGDRANERGGVLNPAVLCFGK